MLPHILVNTIYLNRIKKESYTKFGIKIYEMRPYFCLTIAQCNFVREIRFSLVRLTLCRR